MRSENSFRVSLKSKITLETLKPPPVLPEMCIRDSKKAEPGQFIILRVDENGERIPLTVAGYDREAGTRCV